MEYLVLGLFLLVVPFVLPIALWVALYRTRTRLAALEEALAEQTQAVARLGSQMAQLRTATPAQAAAAPAPPAPAPGPARPAPAPPRPVAPAPAVPAPIRVSPPVIERAPVLPPEGGSHPILPPEGGSHPVLPPKGGSHPTPPPPPPPAPPAPPFDWESLIGDKLFPAVSAIATVLAAIFFLRYSVQQGWLQPPVRVLIGIAVAVALLIVCELKAARKYSTLANSLDAAAVAILFATFFAAHALWDLIPAIPTFALLAMVTALAVLLSIRRESLFIAVLGLLGGFATPALLSSGENRPIPLFAYLVLLNVGLAWVAYRQVWPILTVLTLLFTTAYQWIWVQRFLAASELPVALGIFAVFPVLSITALLFGRRGRARDKDPDGRAFEQSAIVSAALPLAFVAYLAAVPAYGAHPALLFAFLLLIDVGLFAVSLALVRASLHAIGGVATVVVWAVWLATSYQPEARPLVLGFVSAFVLFYLAAPLIARWLSKPLYGAALRAVHAAPALLFVFAVIARMHPDGDAAWTLFAPLLALVIACGWVAIVLEQGTVFFIASFLAVAAEAVWSASHLSVERLGTAAAIYAVFGMIATAVPLIARRMQRPLRPEAGPSIVLIASLGLLLFLSAGPVAPVALWALALLLAILNAALFIESAGVGVPLLAQVGSVLSWIVLALWWYSTAGVVGVLPSLAVVTALTLITLGGHAWIFRSAAAGAAAESDSRQSGIWLGLIGHVFLFLVALNPEWSVPPWPLFGALGVVTLAASVAAVATHAALLHVLAAGAAALVVTGWTSASGWGATGIVASATVSAYALAWMAIAGRVGFGDYGRRAAAAALFVSELTAIVAAGPAAALSGTAVHTPFLLILALQVTNVALLLAITTAAGWRWEAAGVLVVAWMAVGEWQAQHAAEWQHLLVLAGALYLLFVVYALVAGPRQRERREPWLIALGATAMAFFAGRDAFEAGQLQWMIGVVPVVLGAVTAFLLRALLRLEREGERDMTRLALVAGAALALVTVAIPLQLDHQWITIGWALEGAALAWLYLRVPHRGLLAAATVLLLVVFVRLGLNPSIWTYEPRGAMRVFNWYLYTYLIAAGAMFMASWYLARTDDRLADWLPRSSRVLPAAATILLFLLLNIEIADYYATGPAITFRFGVRVSQDLTYTFGWLAFGMILLGAGIFLRNRPSRIAAVSLIAITAFKCFLYDLASLGGLHRVASFVGLAFALALVSLVLQKYVLAKPGGGS